MSLWTRSIFSRGHWDIPSISLCCFCHSLMLSGLVRLSNSLLLSRFSSSLFSTISVLLISALKLRLTAWWSLADVLDVCDLFDLLSIPCRVLWTWCLEVNPNLSELVRSLKCLKWVFFSLAKSFYSSSRPDFGGDGDDFSLLDVPLEAKKLLLMSCCCDSICPEPRDNLSELLIIEWEKQEGVSFPLSMLSSVFNVDN